MPTYTFTHPDNGRTVKITGDAPPDEATIDKIFAETRGAATPTRRAAPPVAPTDERTPFQRLGSFYKTTHTEPFKLAGEALAAPFMAGGKAVMGLTKVLPATLGTLAGGGGLDAALAAGAEARREWEQRGGGQLPFQSKTGEILANRLIRPVTEAAGRFTGQPELVNALVEGAGDVLSLGGGLKPRTIASNLKQSLPGQLTEKAVKRAGVIKEGAQYRGMPFTGQRRQARAAEQFGFVNKPSTPQEAQAIARTSAETDALMNQLKPTRTLEDGRVVPVHPTLGQRTGGLKATTLETNLANKDPGFAVITEFNDAEINRAALDQVRKVMGEGKELPATQERIITGERQLEALKEAQARAKPIHEELYESLGNPELPTDKITKAIATLKANFRPGDEPVFPSRAIGRFEEALSGPKPKHGEKAPPQILDAQGKPIRETQGPPVKQQLGFQDLHSLRKDLGRQIREAEGGANPNYELSRNLKTLKSAVDETIDLNMGMSDKYTLAKTTYLDYLDKFRKGATAKVLRAGDQVGGLKLDADLVPTRLFSAQGSRDFVRSMSPQVTEVGPARTAALRAAEVEGRKAAAKESLPYVLEHLISKTVPAGTEIMNPNLAAKFLRENRTALNNLGITETVNEVIKGQVPVMVEAELKRLGKDKLGNPFATAHEAATIIKRLGSTFERMWGKDGLKKLENWGKTMEVLERTKHVRPTKLPQAAGTFVFRMAEKISALIAVATSHGWLYSSTKNTAKGVIEEGVERNAAAINALLQEGVLDPEKAVRLDRVFNAAPEKFEAEAIRWIKPLIMQPAVSAHRAMQPTPPQEETDASQSTP